MSNNYILAFDFGMKYIGVAVGQVITNQASPVTSLKAKDGIPNQSEISDLISEWRPDKIIVGLPLNMDGTEQPMTHNARKFGNRLNNDFKIPVEFVDERLSTWDAKSQTVSHLKNSKKIENLNANSAVIILEQWFRDKK